MVLVGFHSSPALGDRLVFFPKVAGRTGLFRASAFGPVSVMGRALGPYVVLWSQTPGACLSGEVRGPEEVTDRTADLASTRRPQEWRDPRLRRPES